MTPATDVERLPPACYQMLCPPVAEPGFNDEHELRERWGASWGSHDEVGVLKVVLMRGPGAEFEQIDARHYDPRVDALVDPDGGWYWTGDRAPDLARLAEQHTGLRATLEREGVEVVLAESIAPRFPKAIYTRDPVAPGRVVITDDWPKSIAALERRGVEVIPIPYDEIQHNGGGIHCSTMELLRDPA